MHRFLFDKKIILAIEAVVDIAAHARGRPVQARDIAKRQNIPQRHLEPVMQKLAREGIVKGQRGPNGGYLMSRERRNVTIAQIAKAVRAGDLDKDFSDLATKVVIPAWFDASTEALSIFEAITVEDLVKSAEKEGVVESSKQTADFTI
ncbi:MAG: Rrf2 family transcriptional regulator [Pseudomonadota bacterium]